MSLGLGSEYFNGSQNGNYRLQITYPRSNEPYISYRRMENGSWAGWQRIYAGYADSAYSATTLTGNPTISGSTTLSGNVGIGVAYSTYRLNIADGTSSTATYFDTSYFGTTSGFVSNTNAGYNNFAMYCAVSALFGRWVAAVSDERIKKELKI